MFDQHFMVKIENLDIFIAVVLEIFSSGSVYENGEKAVEENYLATLLLKSFNKEKYNKNFIIESNIALKRKHFD